MYDLATPMTCLILEGPTPEPMQTPPADGLDDVTNGYVPWSMSSITPWAPSNSTLVPASIASFSTTEVSVT
ncbi:hypothetical protein D3C72_2030110 [compost metagenome]